MILERLDVTRSTSELGERPNDLHTRENQTRNTDDSVAWEPE